LCVRVCMECGVYIYMGVYSVWCEWSVYGGVWCICVSGVTKNPIK